MKRIHIILAVAIGALLTQGVHADVFLTEHFSNYADGRLGDSGTGGGGTIPGWNTAVASVTVTNSLGNLDGTSLGLLASVGAYAAISSTNNTGNAPYNKWIAQSTFPQTNPTNLYYSFLYRFDTITNISTDGQLISLVNRQNSGFTSPATYHWLLIAKKVGSSVQFGISKPSSTTTNFAAVNIAEGQTVLVVIRQQIITGATNDVDDLWVNPPANTLGATDTNNIPPVDATTSDGTEDPSSSGPGRFFIVSGGQIAALDELRIASTWAEVTPPVFQCISAGFSSSPSNVTQVAEIGVTLKAVASGTNPNYKWQISTNSGSLWNDIAGAVSSSYTTPNLSLATDNGNQYRAIASIPCDGSSATSAVATVTLTAPVVTPNGVVMDDTFTDPDLGYDDRANTPITSSNSVWYTAVTDNLTAYQQGGNLLATPVSGSSSLWLGYFVADTNMPVHLAVGKAIQVTLPFIPNSFASFTNNAAFRLGLFDYADGGTRVIADGSTAGGSTGNGVNVKGYMLSIDWGTNFSANSPLSLLGRIGMADPNLMGTTGAYASMGSGPSGGGYTNARAFQAGTEYTLVFTVARTAVNTVQVTAAISGGGTNWSYSTTETNLAYHRFDAFAIRPNSLETSADTFTFPQFTVEVIDGPVAPISVPPFSITAVQQLSSSAMKLTWDSVSGASYLVLSRDSLSTGNWTTNATIVATGSSTSYTNSPISGSVTERYYRVLAPPYIP